MATYHELNAEGCALRDKLEKMRLTDLLALNPTLQEMRHVNEVLAIGHGKGANQYHIDEVKKLLARAESR